MAWICYLYKDKAMATKITIQDENSKAAQLVKAMHDNKQAFREAAQKGELKAYVENGPKKFSAVLPRHVPQD
jgi:hypothetical protein